MTIKKLLTVFVCAFCLVFVGLLGACNKQNNNSTPKENEEIKLNFTDCTLNLFGTLQLEIIGGPSGEATWSSENPDIVSVSETGLLEGVSSGSAVVTVRIGEKTAECDCTVLEDSSVPTISIGDLETLNLLAGDSYVITPEIVYNSERFTDGTFTYASSNPEIATVDENGAVTAVELGNTEIIIKASWRQFKDSDYLVISLPVTVVYDLLAKIEQPALTLSPNEMTKYGVEYKASDKLTYVATENGVAVDGEYIVWRSSDEEIVKVDGEGVVTAMKKGTAQITVSYENGNKICESLPITVTVENPVIDFTGRRPVLIDAWVDTADFSIDKTKITYDLSAELFTENYKVTKITDVATGEEITYNGGDFTNTGLLVGEYVWLVENEQYTVKTGVIVATKVITTKSDLLNLQKFGGIYFTEDKDDAETRKYYNYGGYFVLGNDLTFTDADYGAENIRFDATYYHMTSVQKETVGFTGVFNGLGYRIYDISLGTGGIFGNLAKGSVVKNLNVHNALLNENWSGVIAHSVSGSIENCSVSSRLNYKRQAATVLYLLYNGTLSNVHATAISGVYGTPESKGNSTLLCWSRGSACKVESVSVNYTELGMIIEADKASLTPYITVRGDGLLGEDSTAGDIEWGTNG